MALTPTFDMSGTGRRTERRRGFIHRKKGLSFAMRWDLWPL